MAKRFYVEVKGLGDDGAQKLRETGVAEDAILVVEEPTKHVSLVRAIRKVMGLGLDEVFSQKSDRWHVMARIIYTHHAHAEGESNNRIARDLGKDSRTVRNYLYMFADRLYGDKEFKLTNSLVVASMQADDDYVPPEKRKPTTGQKKRRRRSHSKKRPTKTNK